MASVNKVVILGNLGRDPEIHSMPNGGVITTISIATKDIWKDKTTGEKKEVTEWHRVVFFGKLAEIAEKYLKKGSSVFIEGSLRTRKYTDKDGIEKYATDIRASVMQMLGDKPISCGTQPENANYCSDPYESLNHQPKKRPVAPHFGTMENDDIPF